MTKPMSVTPVWVRSVIVLWLLLCIFAMTTILPAFVTCVEIETYWLNMFPVCSKCSCEYIPNILEGLVVDVPETANGNWLRFNRTLNSTGSVVTIFKSTNPTCKVEVKLSALKAPAFFMLLFPAGRDNSMLASTAWGPPGYICTDGQTATVNLGQSAFSMDTELAIAFLTIERQTLKELGFQVLYRQWCDIQLPSTATEGFELPSPPLDGQIRTANLRNFPTFLYAFGRSQFIWSISPPSGNCSVGITFRSVTGTSSPFVLNAFEDIYLGLTYKVATGQEALIRFHDVNPTNALLLNYRTLDCGPRPQNATSEALRDVEIFSWNNVAMPLQVTSEWQQVDFSHPFPLHPRQLVVWYFPGDPISRSNAHPVLLTNIKYLDRNLPGIYGNDFIARYRPVANRLVVFTGSLFARAMFQYRVLPTNTNNTVIIKRQDKVVSLDVAALQTDLTEIIFKAARPQCLVNVGMTSNRVSSLDCAIYGLGSHSDKVPSPAVLTGWNVPVSSIGQGEFRVFLDQLIWMQVDDATVHFMVKMLCPSKSTTVDFASVRKRVRWRFVNGSTNTVWMLPMPQPVQGGQCVLFISSYRKSFRSVVVSCVDTQNRRLWTISVNNWFPVSLGNCSEAGGRMAVIQSEQNPDSDRIPLPGFGYRVQCEMDGSSLLTVPFPRLGRNILAGATWKRIPKISEGASLTIDATHAGCHVELFFPTLDAGLLRIFEDLNDGEIDESMLDGSLAPNNYHSPVLKTRYLSCTSRVYLGREFAWGDDDYVTTFRGAKFRQVCLNKKRSSCGKKMLNLVATREWQTLRVDADMNVNQLRQNIYTLENPLLVKGNGSTSASPLKLQIEFTSVVTESWRGFEIYYGEDGLRTSHELHGVIINNKYLAIAGKSYFFGSSSTVDIRVLPVKMNSFKKGDHIFEVRFRLVEPKKALLDRDQGQIIVANDTVQTFRFNIPKQFSAANGAKIYHDSFSKFPQSLPQWEMDGGAYVQIDAGVLPIWNFKHHYRFEPAESRCRVVLNFTEMDIGSGFIARKFVTEQHRLSVLRDGDATWPVDFAPNTFKMCESTLTNPDAWDICGIPICARMDQTYVSAKNSSSLVVFFRSAQGVEYESLSGTYIDPFFDFMQHPQSTWGSGWTVAYQQICDDPIADQRGRDSTAPLVIKVESSKWRTINVLPGLPSMNVLSLFLTRKYIFVPANPSACAVNFNIGRHPNAVCYGSDCGEWGIQWLIDYSERGPLEYEFVSITVTGIQPKMSPSIVYRVNCLETDTRRTAPLITPTLSPFTSPSSSPISSSAPTSIPIAHPTSSPTRPPRRDGETCSKDSDCSSKICSIQLHRCTSMTCSKGQCGVLNNTPIGCASISSIGCSCVWTAGALCEAVP